MLKKIQRLKKQKSFEKVFATGRSAYNNTFGIKALPNQLKFNQFAVVVSKKNCKLAVDRNRLKRRVRALLPGINSQVTIFCDIVIMILPPAKLEDKTELKEKLLSSFKKLKLI